MLLQTFNMRDGFFPHYMLYAIPEVDLLGGEDCQYLLDVSQVEMKINELIEVDFLVLPSRVQLLPLSQHGLDLLSDLLLGGVVLTEHGLPQGHHLTEGLLSRLDLRLQIVVFSLQQLCRGCI